MALQAGYSGAMGRQDLASAPDGERIDRFLHDLWLQRGLSEHTRNAYRSDLAAVQRWLGHDQSLPRVARSTLFAYLAARFEAGYKPRSTARLLSALRAFFRWQVERGLREDDPSRELASPRLGRPLPGSPSEAEVEALLAAPDVSTLLGLRDRTMLEVLYACGLRVSELVSLTPAMVNLRQGALRVLGKGQKERLVPLGEEAHGWIRRWVEEGSAQWPALAKGAVLFPSQQGRPMTRQTFLAPHQALWAADWRAAAPFSSHLASRLCDPPVEPRRRSARGTAAFGSRGSVDDADLHPRGPGPAEGPPCGAPPPGLGEEDFLNSPPEARTLSGAVRK